MNKLFLLLAIISGVAFGVDKKISSTGDLILSTPATKKVNLNNTLYTTQDGKVGIGVLAPSSPFELSSTDGDKIIYFSNSNVAHGMTNQCPTNVFGRFLPVSSTAGGLDLRGYSDDSTTGMSLVGVIGSNVPTSTVPAIKIVGAKKDGSGTNMTSLGSSETVFQIANLSTNLMTFLGDGQMILGGVYKKTVPGTTSPSHINDFICTTSISAGSSKNIFSITFSNTSAHTGTARVLINSSGESGGSGFGSRIRELHINWIQASAMSVISIHDTTHSVPPSISYTVATNVITFTATATSATSHFCHAIEVQGQTGIYGGEGLTYTRYGD